MMMMMLIMMIFSVRLKNSLLAGLDRRSERFKWILMWKICEKVCSFSFSCFGPKHKLLARCCLPTDFLIYNFSLFGLTKHRFFLFRLLHKSELLKQRGWKGRNIRQTNHKFATQRMFIFIVSTDLFFSSLLLSDVRENVKLRLRFWFLFYFSARSEAEHLSIWDFALDFCVWRYCGMAI